MAKADANWLISIPVWGAHHLAIFANHTIPALRAALEDFKEPYKLLVHTDNPDFVRAVTSDFNLEIKQISQQSTYVALQNAHGDAVNTARIGDRVILLNADIIISKNLLHACKARFVGSKAIVTSGIRTEPGEAEVPIGCGPRDLLLWAWEHRHTIIRDLEWGVGRSMLPTNLFFERGPSVVMHGFHLHPVGIIKYKEMPFVSTIDGDLLDHFPVETIHVVVDPDEMSMLEISPPQKRFPIGKDMTVGHVAASMHHRASPLHKWLFRFRIVVKGDGRDHWEMPLVEDILKIMRGRIAR